MLIAVDDGCLFDLWREEEEEGIWLIIIGLGYEMNEHVRLLEMSSLICSRSSHGSYEGNGDHRLNDA